MNECNQVNVLVGRIFSGANVTEMNFNSVIFAENAERIKLFLFSTILCTLSLLQVTQVITNISDGAIKSQRYL